MGEIERLIQVYQGYQQDPAVQARWSKTNVGNQWIAEERRRAIASLLQGHGFLPLQEKRVLDIGCGSGAVLASLTDLGAQPHNLYGIDLLPDRIEAARQAYPGICFICGNAESLDFPDAHFDLVLLFTVLSSILDNRMAHNVAREACRVLKPGGAVLWYDFRYNNPWNPHVRGITKQQIHQLFPGLEMHLRTITLLPPLARRLGRMTPILYPLLAAIPPLRTHYLGLLIEPKEG
jgi:ubiquinone/menaquinone biosynthesis C-methylase UbiE